MKIVSLLTGTVLLALHAAAEPTPQVVYRSNFQGGVFPEWSISRTAITPRGAHRYLGMFGGNYGAMLQLKDLPPHKVMRIRSTIYQIYSPDGNSRQWGADPWGITIGGTRELLRTTFSFWHTRAKENPQSFPDDYPIDHPAATGVSEIGSLGYRFDKIPEQANEGDHTYKIEVAFPHDDSETEIRFWGEYTHGPPDEAWGIAEVEVEVLPEPIARSEKELTVLWKELLGNDPMRAWNALWRIAESGPAAESFVLKQIGGDPAVKERVTKIVRDLSSPDTLTQEKARSAIDNLSPSAMPLLRAAIADPSTPKRVRDEFADLVGELKAESPLYIARVSRLLRVLNTPRSRELLMTIAGGPGYDGMPSGFAKLAWQAKHAPIGDPWGMRCTFSPDGRQLVTTCGDGARLWDPGTGRLLRYIPANNPRSVALSPDGKVLLLGLANGSISTVNLEAPSVPVVFAGHRGEVFGLCFFSGSQKFVSGGRDGLLWWDSNTLGIQTTAPLPIGRTIRHMSLSPDGKTLAVSEAGDPGQVTLRDVETGELRQQLAELPTTAMAVNFSPDGKLLAATAYNGRSYVFDLQTGKKRIELDEPGPQGEHAVFSPDSKYVCFAGGQGSRPDAKHGLRMIRLSDGAEVWRFSNIGNCIGTAFSPNGEYLASMDGARSVYVWRLNGEKSKPSEATPVRSPGLPAAIPSKQP